MSIRINRSDLGDRIKQITQRREDGTYQGPRFVSDRDVEVVLPIQLNVTPERVRVRDHQATVSAGSAFDFDAFTGLPAGGSPAFDDDLYEDLPLRRQLALGRISMTNSGGSTGDYDVRLLLRQYDGASVETTMILAKRVRDAGLAFVFQFGFGAVNDNRESKSIELYTDAILGDEQNLLWRVDNGTDQDVSLEIESAWYPLAEFETPIT